MYSPISLLETRLSKRVRQVILVGALCLVVLSFGAFSFAPSAHAATVSNSAANTHVVSPNINRVTCGTRTDWLRIRTDFGADIDCFANWGSVAVALYNSDYLCSGNNAGYILWFLGTTYTGQPEYETDFSKNTCEVIDFGVYVHVYSITIYW